MARNAGFKPFFGPYGTPIEMAEPTRRTVLAGIVGLAATAASSTTGRAAATFAQQRSEAPTGPRSVDLTDIESVVDDTLASRIGDSVPGATVAVVNGDETVLTKGYGRADAEAGTEMHAEQTPVRIGSVSKLVTWTAVMQGVREGVLNLDTDVNRYLEDSRLTIPDEYEEPVTLRHLGTHTAGFDVVPNPGIVENSDRLTDLETALVEARPERIRPPGETVSYSNWGATLAGHIVAELFDTSFEEYVQANVFDRLGMTYSTFQQPVPGDHPGDLAAPHDPSGPDIQRVGPVYINWRPAGSMSATATDMAAFMKTHLGHGTDAVLDAETLATMHSEHHGRHPAVNGWRYGFYEHGHPDGNYIGHGGATIYYTSWLGLLPDQDIGVFVGFNSRGSASPGDVADEILAAYDLLPDSRAPESTTDPARRERAETLAGEYESVANSPRNGQLQVLGLLSRLSVEATDGGNLVTEDIASEPTEWVETQPYIYHEQDGDDVLAADVVDGRVTGLYFNSSPQTTFKPVAPHERQAVTLGVLGSSVVGFGLSLAGWAGVDGWRRLKRRRSTDNDEPSSADEKSGVRRREEGSQ